MVNCAFLHCLNLTAYCKIFITNVDYSLHPVVKMSYMTDLCVSYLKCEFQYKLRNEHATIAYHAKDASMFPGIIAHFAVPMPSFLS